MLMVKPNGKELEVHEDSITFALSLGWKEKKTTKKKAVRKAAK